MPTYGFGCEACRVAFDVARSFADADAPVACPVCGGPATRQFVVPTDDQFAATGRGGTPAPTNAGNSGGGWYHGHRHAPGTPGHRH